MSIEELIKRIKIKNSPENAKMLIRNLKKYGESFAKELEFYYDDIHMKYKIVMEYQYVLVVEKNGLYGVIDKDGKEIVPCEFNEYQDALYEWKESYIPDGSNLLAEDSALRNFKTELKNKHDELITSGVIKQASFFENRKIRATELVKLFDGSIGFATSIMINLLAQGKNIEITNANGEHIAFLSEPELFYENECPIAVICSDDNNIYVGLHNSRNSYVACYRMGDFERIWKVSMKESSFQSITLSKDEVLAFDINTGNIYYFDKKTGYINKTLSTASKDGNICSHNLAIASNQTIEGIKNIPLESLGFYNELEVFENALNELSSKNNDFQLISLPTLFERIVADQKNNRIYISHKNKIIVFDENGYLGYFLAPTTQIIGLNFDQETSSLIISMSNGKGIAEVYSLEAINTLLQTTRDLMSKYNVRCLIDDIKSFQNSKENNLKRTIKSNS